MKGPITVVLNPVYQLITEQAGPGFIFLQNKLIDHPLVVVNQDVSTNIWKTSVYLASFGIQKANLIAQGLMGILTLAISFITTTKIYFARISSRKTLEKYNANIAAEAETDPAEYRTLCGPGQRR